MAPTDGLWRAMRGLSEVAFRERSGTEEACRTALLEVRWREALTCPAYGGHSFCELRMRKLFQCNRCKEQVRLTAGTVFQEQAAADDLVRGGLPPDPEQERCLVGRAGPPAWGKARHRLADGA